MYQTGLPPDPWVGFPVTVRLLLFFRLWRLSDVLAEARSQIPREFFFFPCIFHSEFKRVSFFFSPYVSSVPSFRLPLFLRYPGNLAAHSSLLESFPSFLPVLCSVFLFFISLSPVPLFFSRDALLNTVLGERPCAFERPAADTAMGSPFCHRVDFYFFILLRRVFQPGSAEGRDLRSL